MKLINSPLTQINQYKHQAYVANEGPVRIQCKCLVPIYVFPEMKRLLPKQNYNVLSPNSLHSCICERFFYISWIGLPILLQGNIWTDPRNIQIAHRHKNVEIRTEAAQFPEKEYRNGIFLAVYVAKYAQCTHMFI